MPNDVPRPKPPLVPIVFLHPRPLPLVLARDVCGAYIDRQRQAEIRRSALVDGLRQRAACRCILS